MGIRCHDMFFWEFDVLTRIFLTLDIMTRIFNVIIFNCSRELDVMTRVIRPNSIKNVSLDQIPTKKCITSPDFFQETCHNIKIPLK